MKEITCCFTGHRHIPPQDADRIAVRLEQTLRELICAGVTRFGCGGALGFDMLAAQTVLRLKATFPQIRLIMVLPCEGQADGWDDGARRRYAEILSHADKTVYIAKTYTPDCMLRRNRHLVNHSGICVCYLTKDGGGTAYTVRYAKKCGLRVMNIA